MRLTNAVVLVTGASAGIGSVAAARFAARGAHVLVHGRTAHNRWPTRCTATP
jgi:NAD(P)-dependent dehydrogenase (short-subunit alcohol dehydrogenase family)